MQVQIFITYSFFISSAAYNFFLIIETLQVRNITYHNICKNQHLHCLNCGEQIAWVIELLPRIFYLPKVGLFCEIIVRIGN